MSRLVSVLETDVNVHPLSFFGVAVAVLLVGCQLWPDSNGDEEPDVRPNIEENSTLASFDDPVDVAVGDGFRGPWRMNESDFRYVDDPSVAVDDDGVAHMVWVDNEQQDAFYQRFGADGQVELDEPTNVSNSSDIFSWLPVVAPSRVDDDVVYVLWQEIVFSGGSHGGEIFFARSTDGGESFQEPQNLSETMAGAGKGRLTPQRWNNGSLDMVVGPDDELFVAWTEYEGPLRFSRSTDGGETFEEPRHVAGDEEEPARAPSLERAPDGRLYLAWAVGENEQADIQVATSVDGGETFDDIEARLESPGHSDAPEIAVDNDETLHLVYSDSPDGPFQRYQIFYSYSTDYGASFEAPTELSGYEADEQGANFPSLAVDGPHVFVIWEHYPDFRQRSFGLGMTASDDGGASFESASLVPGTADPDLGFNGGLQGLLMRNIDAHDGRLAIVHSHFLPDQASRVRLNPGNYEPVPAVSEAVK